MSQLKAGDAKGSLDATSGKGSGIFKSFKGLGQKIVRSPFAPKGGPAAQGLDKSSHDRGGSFVDDESRCVFRAVGAFFQPFPTFC